MARQARHTLFSIVALSLLVGATTFPMLPVPKAEAAAPAPEITAVNYQDTLQLGQWEVITIHGTNNGGSAAHQTLHVSFPSNPPSSDIQIGASDLNSAPQLSAAGSSVGSSCGHSVTAAYPFVEGYNSPWNGGDNHYMTVSVLPQSAGTFTFYVKSVATDSSWNVLAEAPNSGTQDQQCQYVYVYTVTVTQPSTSVSITFSASGLGSDATGNILTVNGANYAVSQLPKTFSWASGSPLPFGWNSVVASTSGTQAYGWHSTSGCGQSGGTGTIITTSSCTVSATYTPFFHVTMAASPSGDGTVTWSGAGISSGSTSASTTFNVYNPGTILSITATPASEFTFASWSSSSSSISVASPTSESTTATIDGGGTITASFSAAAPSTGGLTVTVKNSDGSLASTLSPAGTTVVKLWTWAGTGYGTYIGQKTINAASQVTWTGLTAGTYVAEVYHQPGMALDQNEFWGGTGGVIKVSGGTTTSYIFVRHAPILGTTTPSAVSIAKGGTVTITVTIHNLETAAKNCEARVALDQTKSSPYDYERTSASASIAAGTYGTFATTFTPSTTGTFYYADVALCDYGAGFVPTDQSVWSTSGITVGAPITGSLTVTVESYDGSFAYGLGGSTWVLLYDPTFTNVISTQYLTTSASQVTFTGLSAGTYPIEVYHQPTTGLQQKEFWGNDKVSVSGSASYTFVRHAPILSTVTFSSPSITLGQSINVSVTVKNLESVSISTSVCLYLNPTQSASGAVCLGFQTIAAGSISPPWTYTYTPTAAGTYYRAVYAVSMYGSNSPATDQTPWSAALTVNKATPDLSTIVQPSSSVTVGTATYDTASLGSTIGGVIPIGTVTYNLYASGSCIGSSTTQTVTLSSGSVPDSQSRTLVPGSFGYIASYSGDSNYAGVTSSCEPFTVQASSLAATASSNSTTGTAPLTIQFTGSASGGVSPYSYLWDFGDGVSSSLQNPSHTYSIAGSYAAKLIVTDSKGTEATANLVVVSVQEASGLTQVSILTFSINQQIVSLGGKVTFTIQVQNTGSTPGQAWPYIVILGPTNQTRTYLGTVPDANPASLNPGESATISGSWTVPSDAPYGVYSVILHIFGGNPKLGSSGSLAAVGKAFWFMVDGGSFVQVEGSQDHRLIQVHLDATDVQKVRQMIGGDYIALNQLSIILRASGFPGSVTVNDLSSGVDGQMFLKLPTTGEYDITILQVSGTFAKVYGGIGLVDVLDQAKSNLVVSLLSSLPEIGGIADVVNTLRTSGVTAAAVDAVITLTPVIGTLFSIVEEEVELASSFIDPSFTSTPTPDYFPLTVPSPIQIEKNSPAGHRYVYGQNVVINITATDSTGRPITTAEVGYYVEGSGRGGLLEQTPGTYVGRIMAPVYDDVYSVDIVVYGGTGIVGFAFDNIVVCADCRGYPGLTLPTVGATVSVPDKNASSSSTINSVVPSSGDVTISAAVANGHVAVNVTSTQHNGRLIILDLNQSLLSGGSFSDISVKVDGQAAYLAANMTQLVPSTSPAYLVLLGAAGVQVLVWLPSFSSHTIDVYYPTLQITSASRSITNPATTAQVTSGSSAQATRGYGLYIIAVILIVAALVAGVVIGDRKKRRHRTNSNLPLRSWAVRQVYASGSNHLGTQ